MPNMFFGLLLGLVAAGAILTGCGTESANTAGPEVLFVDSEQVDCVGVAPQKCLRVRSDPGQDWTLFYDSIHGFDFEPDNSYELRVMITEVVDPPADGSSLRYDLVEIVSVTPVDQPAGTGRAGLDEALLATTWQWVDLDLGPTATPMVPTDPERYSIVFEGDRRYGVTADCNTGGGDYETDGRSLVLGPAAVTRRQCPPDSIDSTFLRLLGTVTGHRVVDGRLILELGERNTMTFAPATTTAGD